MKELISQLEEASEGSRKLDVLIWVAIFGKGQPMRTIGSPAYDPPRFFCNPFGSMKSIPADDWIGYDLLNIALPYTTSLDAALTLIPADTAWDVAFGKGVKGAAAVGAITWQVLNKPTPVLALCIAALKARSEDTQGDQQ